MNNLIWFDVYLKGELIDSIPSAVAMTTEEMKKSLIGHDGYDSNIEVLVDRPIKKVKVGWNRQGYNN